MSHNDVGDELLVAHEVRDLDGELVNAATAVLTVTRPDLTTEQPAIANPPEETGRYEVGYTLTQAGRYVFAWSTTSPNTASATAVEAVKPGGLPTLAQVKTYLGDVAAQWTDADIQDALDAETAAQARMHRTGPEYPADLAQALKRRVQRNLAMRALSLGVLTGDGEGGDTILPGRDPEVRRLEAPFRRVVIA